jgi:hypothetical protein
VVTARESSSIQEGARAIEFLHLAFLQVLATQIDPARYVLKGGANLRLFYGSFRRSQGIDLDIVGKAGWSTEERVDRVLAGRPFRTFLDLAGVSMTEPTKPKQSETTRRWKFTVSTARGYLNTKIEVSGRPHPDPEFELSVLTPRVGREVGLRAIRVQRYLPAAAIRQKVRALAERTQTEPRDVFDLDLLLSRFPEALPAIQADRAIVDAAIAATFEIEYSAFEDLVVEYLEPEFVDIYRRPEVWDEMVLKVTSALGALR